MKDEEICKQATALYRSCDSYLDLQINDVTKENEDRLKIKTGVLISMLVNLLLGFNRSASEEYLDSFISLVKANEKDHRDKGIGNGET